MATRKIELDFGQVTISDNAIIAEMKEGIVFDIPDNERLLYLGKEHFGDKPYGYISYRKHSYTVNPTVYMQTAQRSNIKAIAIVASSKTNTISAEVEKQFFEHPFEVFTTIEEAQHWMTEQLAMSSN